MAVYQESGLRLTLADGSHFRFADLAAYRSISGQNLKEMDFAWAEGQNLVLLELRNYLDVTGTLTGADFVPRKGEATPKRFNDLVDKVTDSLLMILAARAQTTWGKQLATQWPPVINQVKTLTLVIAIELKQELAVHLQALRDSLNARLQGRLAVAGVSRVALLDYSRLKQHPRFSGVVACD